MADTAHKTEEEMKEHFDPPEELQRKVDQLVQWIRASKHFIVFTGAGISTSAGIPDFRGPEGVWTLKAQGRKRTGKTTSSLKAIPTLTHMSLVQLQSSGLCHYLVSQNCDGLHRKSGIHPDRISEVHGNTNLERCTRCSKEYLRDYHVRNNNHVHQHATGRKCNACGGELADTIINFGENLPEVPLARGFQNAEAADLCLVLGSSCTVTPAANIPKTVGKKSRKTGSRLVICNLQRTPLDRHAALIIHAKCDDLMKLVMDKLNMTIPPFTLQRRLQIQLSSTPQDNKKSKHEVKILPLDIDGTPATFIKSIQIEVEGAKTKNGKPIELTNEPFVTEIAYKLPKPSKKDKEEKKITPGGFRMKIEFMGHYNEPVLEMGPVPIGPSAPHTQDYLLSYDPLTGIWRVHDGLDASKSNDAPSKGEKSKAKDEPEEEEEGRGGDGEEEIGIVLGNTHERITKNEKEGEDKRYHQWKMYVKAKDENDAKLVSQRIEKVRYKLHPTFKDRVLEVTEYPYVIERVGWGTFEVKVTIFWNDQNRKTDEKASKSISFRHMLSFDGNGEEKTYFV